MGSNRETILEYLWQTLFPTITTTNGYNFTIGLVERGIKSVNGLNDSKFPCIFIGSADEDPKDISNGTFESLMTVHLVCYVKAEQQKIQIQLDKLIEDIRKCVYKDPTQGNRVAWTRVGQITPDWGDDENYGAFHMILQFQYQGEYVAP